MNIVNLLSDFGDKDNFVDVMRTLILKMTPAASIKKPKKKRLTLEHRKQYNFNKNANQTDNPEQHQSINSH